MLSRTLRSRILLSRISFAPRNHAGALPLLGCTLLLITSANPGAAQPAGAKPPVASDAEIAATRAQVTALRDTFVAATAAAGLKCAIAPPTLVIEDVPSFGSYDPETNTLRTSTWNQMTEAEKALFFRFLGPGTTEAAARQEFEDGAHHWVFIHELGHWWQACRGLTELTDHGDHYAIEFGADRIAAAYWRERDPSVIAHQQPVFAGILEHTPNPVPEGQRVEPFFNANYEKLGPTPAYIWFQARMCLTAFQEKPAPTFVETLRQTSASPH